MQDGANHTHTYTAKVLLLLYMCFVYGNMRHCRPTFIRDIHKRVRGNFKLDVYGFNNSAASGSKSGLYASNESFVCPLSYGVW